MITDRKSYTEAFKREAVRLMEASGKGDPYDHATRERFFSTVRAELTNLERFLTRQTAQTALFEFIEVFYNRQRLDSSLGYRSPADFETAFLS